MEKIRRQALTVELLKQEVRAFVVLESQRNALQWRLQYNRVIEKASEVDEVVRIV